MRNLKKLLAVVVTIAMIATFAIPAFAADAAKTDAQIVTDLGMLKGAGAGVTAEYLATQPDRLQAAILFLRLLGKEAEAKAFTGTDNFTDVAGLSAENTAILAYLKANPDLGYGGIGGDKFDPLAKMTAKAYYKVVLVALGFAYGTDFTWENVMSFAASKGLIKNIDVETFTVNDLAVATVEGLKATVKGGTDTLIAKLVAAGTVTSAAAVSAGLYTVPLLVPKVDSVSASNLKEIVVAFNTALDETTAEDKANYLLDDADLTDDDSVALNDDGKSVTISLNVAFGDNQQDFDLTVSGVKSAAGVEMVEQTISAVANDVSNPVATGVTLTGPNTFDVAFSEPIDVEGSVEVADDVYGVAEITIDGSTATVKLSDSTLAEGDYKVVVKGFADYAGLKSLSKQFTLKYAKDTTIPAAKIIEATQTKVVIEFNEAVFAGDPDVGTALGVDFFYHTFSSYTPATVDVDSNKEFTLNFDADTRALPEGNVKVVVVYDADGKITDAWGNEMKENAVLTAAITADNTKPEVTKLEADGQDIINVYFSEAVENGDDTADNDATNPDNYVVKNSDGDVVDVADITYDVDDDFASLEFAENLQGTYTVEISGINDQALTANKMNAVTKSIEIDDSISPDLTVVADCFTQTIDDDSDAIYVTFPEDMATSGNYSILDKDKYLVWDDADSDGIIDAGETADLADKDTIATFGGSDKIKITIKDGTTYDVEGADMYLLVGKVADAAGNKTATQSVALEMVADTAPVLAVDGVKTIDSKTIEITIDGELKTVVASGIQVAKGADPYEALASIKSWKLDGGQTIITGVLKAAEQLDGSDDTDLFLRIVADKLVSTTGLAMEAETYADAVQDGYAPSLDEITAVGNTFEIAFDEVLDAAREELAANDLVVTCDGDALVAGIDYETTIAGDTITVTFADAPDGKYTIKSKDTITYITDAAGNKANAFTDLVKKTW